MKPQIKLAETATPEGGRLALFEHDGSYAIRLNGQGLMDSSRSGSEATLGELAVARLGGPAPARVLVGGLGLGVTLRSVLEHVGAQATVEVAELVRAVVEWNRGFLFGLNGALLEDPRVEVVTEDVWELLGRGAYDAVVLDVDNGPAAMVHGPNARLYGAPGLGRLAAALKPGGRAVVWSAGGEERGFTRRLGGAGLRVEVVPAKPHPRAKRCSHTIYVADKPGG